MSANHGASATFSKLILPRYQASTQPMTMPSSTAMLPRKPLRKRVMNKIITSTRVAMPRLNGSPYVGAAGLAEPAAQLTPTRISEMPIMRMIDPVTTGGKAAADS